MLQIAGIALIGSILLSGGRDRLVFVVDGGCEMADGLCQRRCNPRCAGNRARE